MITHSPKKENAASQQPLPFLRARPSRVTRIGILLATIALLAAWSSSKLSFSLSKPHTPPSLPSKQRVNNKLKVTNDTTTVLDRVDDRKVKSNLTDYTVINSFRFCTPLQGASFAWNQHPTLLREQIDKAAHDLFIDITDRYPLYRPMTDSALRFSCLMAAHANNTIISNSTTGLLLRHIDPPTFFPNLSIRNSTQNPHVLATMSTTAKKPCKLKQKYKLVYAIFVHTDLDTIKFQYSRLKHDDALIMYHVDARNRDLFLQLNTWIMSDTDMVHDCNVLVVGNPISVYWGHVSIVFSHLEVYFQAFDIAEWDHIINLSVYDYPLKSLTAIVSQIKPDTSYIKHEVSRHREDRLRAVPFETTNPTHPFGFWYTDRTYELRKDFTPYQHDQWMILSRSFVNAIRTSQSAFDLLAWMEHTFIPDEMFFATWARSPWSHVADMDIVNNMMRFLRFTGTSPNPDWLTINDTIYFNDDHLFARKIRALEQTELVKWIDDRKADIDKKMTDSVHSDHNVTVKSD